ncbi:DNA polymerase III subunit beta [Desulfoluna spongiiphila]|uniref:Beta sliding clamp n=1 Tax=Desulfoluna spongiiphila TaxID=419481 RepID=A0A1G5J5Y2_9BACT|nr:DNA polymerase III subunit beta [Desulfoluna spongiiphila]SCY83604.1 DNA polymerase-3 subunit beta [Desulfoluna spongiiphila]VVS92983.1 dna polymerase iii beta sliding clamp [Desulfoluna spongiiphila]
MKFKIAKKDISTILGRVQGITGRKSNLAITANVLIKGEGQGISFVATDLETGFEGHYTADVEREGAITINAKKLFEIVQNFPGEEVLIEEIERQWIEIKNNNIVYHIVGMSPDDFPDVPRVDEVTFTRVATGGVREMIEKTVMIQAPSDEKRAHITGVCFERIQKDGQNLMRMVSTDGRRLCKVDVEIGEDANFVPGESVIVPKKGLMEAAKILDKEEEHVEVGVKDNYLIFKMTKETVIIGLLEGDFPEYEQVIEKDDTYDIEVDRKLFSMMLKRMSILSSDSYNSVIFNFADNRLEVTATNPDLGESKEDMAIAFERDEVEVAFNPKYLIDTLNVINDERILVNLRDNHHPCLVEGVEEKRFLSIIMPMKI